MDVSISKPVLRLACCGLALALLPLAAGCGKNRRSVEQAEVTGTVMFRGKPLPGGQITFVTTQGGFAANGTIDEHGKYQIQAPVGEVEIGVNNQMLQRDRSPREGSHPQAPDAEKSAASAPIKGRYIEIPSEYADPHSSGLKYTVKAETQTHDIELSAKPPAAGATHP